MKADERHHLEENELAAGLTRAWDGVRSGSNAAVAAVVVVGVVVAALFGWSAYSSSRAIKQAKAWTDYDLLADLTALREYVKKAPAGQEPTRAARFQLARVLLGPEGLEKFGSADESTRERAVANIEEARALYGKLAEEAKADAVLASEALLGVARAEESLIGVPKSSESAERRGSVDKAIDAYTRVQSKYQNTPAAREAGKRLKDLQDRRDEVVAFYTDLYKALSPRPLPKLPDIPAPVTPKPEEKKPEPKADEKKPEEKKAEDKKPGEATGEKK